MKKQILIYLAGILTGVLLYGGISSLKKDRIKEENAEALVDFIGQQISESLPKEPEFSFLKEPGENLGDYKYQVEEVLHPEFVLVYELEKSDYGDHNTYRKAVLYDPNKPPFYDDQIIEIPSGYCAKHIGTYKHGYKLTETTPIIKIMKK